jgi:hydrogenase/urease accessory protein HupE
MTRLLIILLALLWPTGALADELRPGYLALTEQTPGQWQMVWKAPIKEGLATRAAPTLPGFCTIQIARREVAAAALIVISDVRCSRALAGSQVGLSGLDATFTDALVRVAPLGRPIQASRLTVDAPMVEVAVRPDRLQVARTYLKLGVEHILFGFDHLLFVIALVLLLRGGWLVAKTVTAFTVAHSVTLIGTSLGWMSLPRAPVEAVIALSIVFVAVEIVKADPAAPRLSQRAPWLIAFLFGLLHGFGFAGALAEIGMPETEVPTALLTFNLGVEAGQLAIVAVALATLAVIRRVKASTEKPARLATAYVIGAWASYWFIQRMVV